MKIIYLIHQFFPEFQTGTERFALNNALMAQKFGNKVKVITYSFYENSFYEYETHGILYKEFFFRGIPVIAFKYRKNPPNINLVLHNNLLYGFAQTVMKIESPDLIHVGHSMRVHEFVWVAKEMGIPYAITLTDYFLLCPKVNLTPDKFSLCSGPKHGEACANLCKEFFHPYIVNRLSEAEDLLANASKIISPSRFLANIFKQEFNQLNLDIIHHGIQYKYIKQNDRLYCRDDQLIFGYAGSLIYHKGVQILLRAFIKIKDKNVKLRIYGYGKADFVKNIEKIVENDTRVTFYGKYSAEQLGDIFESIDVLVIPSICYENYPMVLHEALVSNIPVIGTRLGVFVKKIKDGFNGFTFLPGNSDDLQKKMEQIINAPSLLNKMKENIKTKIIVPTIEQEAYEYFEIYNKMMGFS